MNKLFLVICLSILINISTLYAGTKSGNTNIETIGLIERVNVNKIDLPIENDGSTGDDARSYYPAGQTMLSFLFQGGFATTAYVNGELRASWMSKGYLINDWQPGIWGMDPTDQFAKFYIVNSSDGFGSPAFIDWQNAVNLGADFQDLDGNGIYDPYIDRPAISGDRTIWFPLNDNTSMAQRTPRLNTKPVGLESHITVWAWDRDDEFEDVIFFRYRLINATDTVKNDVIFSIWADSDLGAADDDLCAADSLLNLGYIYNDSDDLHYGINPPAFGVQILQGAIVPSIGDTAFKIAGNFKGIDTLYDAKNTTMTSFLQYEGWHPLLPDPNTATIARYYQIGGLNAQGNPIDPTAWGTGATISTNPKYFYSGDPLTGSGWIDNTNSDKRFLINCGLFNMANGDTQDIIFTYEVSQGTDALSSIEILKQRASFFNSFLPYGRILTIQSNKKIASLDSIFEFKTSLSSFSDLDTIQSVDWFLLEKPVTSMAMIVPGSNFSSVLNPDMVGDYSIELQAIVTENDTLFRTITVFVVNNHPPIVHFSIDPDDIIFGDKLFLDASNSFDPDGDILIYDWLLPEWLQTTTFDTSFLEIIPPHTGSDIINLTVRDNYFSIVENDTFNISPMQNGLELIDNFVEYSSIAHLQLDSIYLFILNNTQNLSIINIQTDSLLLSGVNLGNSKFVTDAGFIASVHDFSGIELGEIDSTFTYQQQYIFNELVLNNSFADIYLKFPHLFIPLENPKELRIYDITDPQNPNLINNYPLPILTKDVSFSEGFAAVYTRYPNLGLITLDISDPNIVTALDTLLLPINDKNIEYDLNRIYVLNSLYEGNEISVIDASNPSELHHAATININSVLQGSFSSPILEMKAIENNLFVMTKDGVKLFDVSDPYTPKEIANFHTGLEVSDIAWNFPFLYAGIPGDLGFGAGLNVLEYDSSFVYSIDDNPPSQLPTEFSLSQNYPNPFNPSTTINYELPKTANVKIQIFDILGQHVKTLVDIRRLQGKYKIKWDGLNYSGKQVASGLYFYSIQTENFVKTKKMLLIR